MTTLLYIQRKEDNHKVYVHNTLFLGIKFAQEMKEII